MKWPKYWSFSFIIIPSKEIPGLLYFRMDWLDVLAVQGTLKSFLQHQFKSINSSALSLLRASKVMLKILQARLQQYVHCELPDVQAGFRKGRGTRGQIANIHWITEKAREFQKNIYFCFLNYAKAFDCVDHNKLENS